MCVILTCINVYHCIYVIQWRVVFVVTYMFCY